MVLFVRLALGALAFVGSVSAVSAQTTVVLSQPDTQVWQATVRGGSYASTNLSSILETRSSDTAEYLRRVLLKFDTQNSIPAGANVTSATLTMTVKQGSADASRRLGVYQVTTSWEEPSVSWKYRKSGTSWGTAGGDLGTRITEQTVSNTAGSKVTFDVTPLVQQAVAGQLGSSRYTRVALVDLDAATKESWRAYYTSHDANTAVRPVLKVIYGGTATAPPPPPTTTTTTGKILRVLQYNIGKNGWGTDGVYDPNRVANWVVKMNPDVISFNELEKWNSYSKGLDGVAQYKQLLEQKTGVKWYLWDAQDYGDWDGKGLHNAIFSKYPLSSTYRHMYSAGKLKTLAGATIVFNGRTINFMATHFDPYSASYRLTQARDLVAYAKSFAENRILCGDFNDQPGDPPITTMTAAYHDAWAVGKSQGIAYSAPDNPYGNTRNSRIDYIFYSRLEQHLTLKKVEVVDTRDSDGDMPSDHRPVLAEFLVQ
jgi:endonuclease/exonuclease/phosphatase family metal-dependent hydrolase